jgi:hypothetical protein
MIVNEEYYPSFKNHELIYDLNLQAFSIYDISGKRDDSMPGLVDYLIYPEHTTQTDQVEVYSISGEVVLDASNNVVTVDRERIQINKFEPRQEVITFLYLHQQVQFSTPTYFGFSRYLNEFGRDWDNIIDGASYNFGFYYPSYMLTGYNLTGDMSKQGQAIYLQTFCKRTEQYFTYYPPEFDRASACMVSSQWDWNDSNAQGKWGTQFNSYRFTKKIPTSQNWGDPFDYGETVIYTKNKLRGRGHSLAILFESEASPYNGYDNRDLRLLGWNILMTKNGEP